VVHSYCSLSQSRILHNDNMTIDQPLQQ